LIKGLIKKQKTHKLIVLLLLLKFSALHALLEASASASMPNLPLLMIVIAPILARIVLMGFGRMDNHRRLGGLFVKPNTSPLDQASM